MPDTEAFVAAVRCALRGSSGAQLLLVHQGVVELVLRRWGAGWWLLRVALLLQWLRRLLLRRRRQLWRLLQHWWLL